MKHKTTRSVLTLQLVLACLYVPAVEEALSRLIFADRFDAPLESGGS